MEFQQYQDYIRNYIEDHDEFEDWPNVKRVRLFENIPMSLIIESAENVPNQSIDDLFLYQSKAKAYKLYQKYIKIGSEFELNIDSGKRRELYDVLDDFEELCSSDLSLRDLYVLFESAKEEMIVLLTFSLNRFRSDTTKFEQVLHIFEGPRDTRTPSTPMPPSTPLPMM